MKIFIPQNIRTELFNDNRTRERCLYLIHRVGIGSRVFKNTDKFGYTILNSKLLRKLLGSRYKKYINILIDNKIFKDNNHYYPQSFSKSYKLTNEYNSTKLIGIEISDDFIRKTNKMNETNINLLEANYLKSFTNMTELTLDMVALYDFIKTNDYTTEQFNSSVVAAELFDQKQFFCIKDSYGRFHTNLTNFPSDLRQFFKHDNQDIVEIDISNCQPLLLSILFNNTINNTVLTDAYSNITSPSLSFSHMCPTFGSVVQTIDYNFKRDVENGEFYDILIKVYRKLYNEEIDKATLKTKLFEQIFFGRIDKKKTYKVEKVFKSTYPDVADFIYNYKKKDYKKLSTTLQSIEAKTIFNLIGSELIKSGIWFTTIHDSIITVQKHAEFVVRTIKEVFKQHYDLNVAVKIK